MKKYIHLTLIGCLIFSSIPVYSESKDDNDIHLCPKILLSGTACAGFLALTCLHLRNGWAKYQEIVNNPNYKDLKHWKICGIILHTHFDESQLPQSVRPAFNDTYNAMRYDDVKSIICLIPAVILGIIAFKLSQKKLKTKDTHEKNN